MDWDYDYLEYLWCSVLNRNDFEDATPRQLFNQIEAYKKFNNPDEKCEKQESQQTYVDFLL